MTQNKIPYVTKMTAQERSDYVTGYIKRLEQQNQELIKALEHAKSVARDVNCDTLVDFINTTIKKARGE